MKIINLILVFLSFYISFKVVQSIVLKEAFIVPLLIDIGAATGVISLALLGAGVTGIFKADPVTVAFIGTIAGFWTTITITINSVITQFIPSSVHSQFAWIQILISGIGYLLIIFAGIQMTKGGWATYD